MVSSSSKDFSQRETRALALIKVALGLDEGAMGRCTNYVVHLSSVGASSKLLLYASLAFDSVDGDFPWRIMAADRMPPPKLLKLTKTYYVLTEMIVRVCGAT